MSHFRFPYFAGSLMLSVLVCGVQPAIAIPPFFEQFKARYTPEEGATEQQQALAKLVESEESGKCLICHVKGQKKTVRNHYGMELAKLLKKKDFSKQRLESDGDNARKEIIAALEKVEALRSDEGNDSAPTFGEVIAMGVIPSAKVAVTAPSASKSAPTTSGGGSSSELLESLVTQLKKELKAELVEQLKSELKESLQETIREEVVKQRAAAVRAERLVAEKKYIDKIEKIGGTVREIAINDDRKEIDFHLGGKSLTDEGLAHVKQLDNVIHLHLKDTQITDDGLKHLSDLEDLAKLHLEKTKITDQGLVYLTGLDNLEYLNIYGTEVTDDGIQQLAGMKNLKKLYIWQTKVTIPGFQKAKENMPDVEIIPDLVVEKKRAEDDAKRREEEKKKAEEEAKKKDAEQAEKKDS